MVGMARTMNRGGQHQFKEGSEQVCLSWCAKLSVVKHFAIQDKIASTFPRDFLAVFLASWKQLWHSQETRAF